MNWLFQGRSSIFYLILTAVLGFSIYWFITGVTKPTPKLLNYSHANVTKSCGTSRVPELVTPLDSYLKETDTGVSTSSLQVGTIQLTASDHFLTAKTEGGKVKVAVKQPDYGAVRSLHLTKSGEIFAIGDQISYRLRASVRDRMPVLTEPVPLPFLFSETCGLFGRIDRSCSPNEAIYSQELDAVFLYGHASFGGFTSLVLGLASGDQEISNSVTPLFLGDVPHTGRVLLGGPKGFALFDGQVITPCSGDS